MVLESTLLLVSSIICLGLLIASAAYWSMFFQKNWGNVTSLKDRVSLSIVGGTITLSMLFSCIRLFLTWAKVVKAEIIMIDYIWLFLLSMAVTVIICGKEMAKGKHQRRMNLIGLILVIDIFQLLNIIQKAAKITVSPGTVLVGFFAAVLFTTVYLFLNHLRPNS